MNYSETTIKHPGDKPLGTKHRIVVHIVMPGGQKLITSGKLTLDNQDDSKAFLESLGVITNGKANT